MRFILISSLIFLANLVNAQEALNYTIHNHYNTPRSLGMGNAVVAVSDDYSALFMNPAMLNVLKEGEINIGIGAGISKDFPELVDDIDEASDSSSGSEVSALEAALNKHAGQRVMSRLQPLEFIWARPGWGFGFIPIDFSLELGVDRSITPAIQVEGRQDTTFAFGYAKNVTWLGQEISVGGTLKAIYRGYVGKTMTAFDLIDPEYFSDEDAQEGMGLDLDLGFYHDAENWWKWKWAIPRFGLVVRNLLDFGYTQNFNVINDNSTEPPKSQRRLDLGSAWQLPKFWMFDPKVAIDIRNIMHDQWTFRKGLHIGAELGWEAFSWLKGAYRIGLNQTYLSAGVSAQFAWFRLDLATWGEEVKTSKNYREDRRYMLKMNTNF